MSLAHATLNPADSKPSRTKPMPAKNSSTYGCVLGERGRPARMVTAETLVIARTPARAMT
jgi:hypothetical protein